MGVLACIIGMREIGEALLRRSPSERAHDDISRKERGEPFDHSAVPRNGLGGEAVGETVRRPCEHPANASTNRSGRLLLIASVVPEKHADMPMRIN